MKAVVATGYGATEVLRLTDRDKPAPGPDEVLVKVYAASVTAADSMMRRGDPAYARLFLGLRRPKNEVPGTGLAGVVEAVGSDVTRFAVGDAVFGEAGLSFGAHAEYVSVPEDGVLLHKPESLSFEDAALMCDGPLTSLNFLKRMAAVEPGQRVLINGASGSLGTAAIQIAKAFGAEVMRFPGFGSAEPADVIAAPRWHPTDPKTLIHFNNRTMEHPDVDFGVEPVIILKTDVTTQTTETVVDLSEDPTNYYWASGGRSRSFEELSRDGKWTTLFVQKGVAGDDPPMYFVSYNLQANAIGLELKQDQLVAGNVDCENLPGAINWVAPSPLGTALVIQWNASGNERCTGVEAYDMITGAYSGHIGVSPSHSDLGVDHQGREIYVTNYVVNSDRGASQMLTATLLPGVAGFEPTTEDGGINTDNGVRALLDTVGDFHVTHLSCKGPPGVCVVTADYNDLEFDAPGEELFDNEIYLVYTDGRATVGDNSAARMQRLAHHHSVSLCTETDTGQDLSQQLNYDYEYNYRAQSQATVSPKGKYVVFASNRGDCANSSEDYLITLSGCE